MTRTERMEQYYWNLNRAAALCVNCRHFHRHYVRDWTRSGSYIPIDGGHCSYPRVKDRKAYDTCGHFENKENLQG